MGSVIRIDENKSHKRSRGRRNSAGRIRECHLKLLKHYQKELRVVVELRRIAIERECS